MNDHACYIYLLKYFSHNELSLFSLKLSENLHLLLILSSGIEMSTYL